jgi:hypothetical protein
MFGDLNETALTHPDRECSRLMTMGFCGLRRDVSIGVMRRGSIDRGERLDFVLSAQAPTKMEEIVRGSPSATRLGGSRRAMVSVS